MSKASTQISEPKPSDAVLITKQDLVAGDIIATRAHTFNSVGVRVATGGRVSHAILYTGRKLDSYRAVDATERGVTSDFLFRKLEGVSCAVVFRHHTATPQQRDKACAWADLQASLNKPYDYLSAARVGLITPYTKVGRLIIMADELDAATSPEGEDASFFCSELVFRAFEVAGAPLTKKPAHRMNPHSLFHTHLLAFMGRLV
jgi:hypothetical protein